MEVEKVGLLDFLKVLIEEKALRLGECDLHETNVC
jgi:hypothetical protein